MLFLHPTILADYLVSYFRGNRGDQARTLQGKSLPPELFNHPLQGFSVTLCEKQEHQMTSKLNIDVITQLLKETLHYCSHSDTRHVTWSKCFHTSASSSWRSGWANSAVAFRSSVLNSTVQHNRKWALKCWTDTEERKMSMGRTRWPLFLSGSVTSHRPEPFQDTVSLSIKLRS